MVVRIVVNFIALLWYLFIAGVIYFGWQIREYRYFIPESGIGYWLGIIGGSMMLLLLVYPLRKKNPGWKFLGSIKFWFRFHMILGVIGPVLVIYHSGYELGSLNGRVAFIAMLIVASSGLVGRYLYRSIHRGLYGKKLGLDDLRHKDVENDRLYESMNARAPELLEKLHETEEGLLNKHTGVNRSLFYFLSRRWRLRKLRRSVLKKIEPSTERRNFLDRIWSLRSICNLGINEILFSYWHILHFPLFLILVISGIFHVIVVHFY